MGNCKECEAWKNQGKHFGVCEAVTCINNELWHTEQDRGDENIRTHKTFGCIFFRKRIEKQPCTRPFYVLEDSDHNIFVAIESGDSEVSKVVGLAARSECGAHKAADILNDLWERRGKRSCRNCVFMDDDRIRCYKEHGENYTISCNEWEPR